MLCVSALKWVTCRNGSKCPAPVQVTNGNNQPLVAVARHKGGLFPGVFLPDANTCYISWGGKAFAKPEYFVSDERMSSLAGTYGTVF